METAIVGYTFHGRRREPHKIFGWLRAEPDDRFDRYLNDPMMMDLPVEYQLDRMAADLGYDRHNEESFSDTEFPHTVIVTSFPPPEVDRRVNVALILTVIQRINEKPHLFNMGSWVNKQVEDDNGDMLDLDATLEDVLNPRCGTTMCGAGHILAATGHIDDQLTLITNSSSAVVPAALRALGLSEPFERLFYAERWPTTGEHMNRNEQVREFTRLLTCIALGENPWFDTHPLDENDYADA